MVTGVWIPTHVAEAVVAAPSAVMPYAVFMGGLSALMILLLLTIVGLVVYGIVHRERILDHGIIEKMEYVPASSGVIPIPGVNGIVGMAPFNNPERFKLHLRSGDTTGVWYVDRATYMALRVGYVFRHY